MKSLVEAHLERIPGDVFVKFQEEIKALVSKQHGVYALYKGDKLYYVGLAKNLKSRVQKHLSDRHKDRWDRFSLYLVRHVEHIKELETLAIHISQPRGNKQKGRFPRSSNLRPQLKKLLQETIRTMFAKSPHKRRKHSRTSKVYRQGALSPLKGLLPSGAIIKKTYRGQTFQAQVDSEGKVVFNGKTYSSLSTAAESVINHAVNGWKFWTYQDKDGNWVKLDKLRK